MPKYFIHLAYKGTKYAGWQRQKEGIRTVQQVIEDAIIKMLGYKITIHGCGRTDSGVHSSSYYAHIEVREILDYDPVFRLNKMLPKDIVIYDWIQVTTKANAQLDAENRTYKYFVHRDHNPFLQEVSTHYEGNWNLDLMHKVVDSYTKTSDFKYFCRSPNQYEGRTQCVIDSIDLDLSVPDRLVFTITANRFLQSQIRLMVGRLMDVGTGKMTIEDFHTCCSVGFPPFKHKLAKPQGLFLSNVQYVNDIYPK